MITQWDIYWITRMDYFHYSAFGLGVAGTFICLILAAGMYGASVKIRSVVKMALTSFIFMTMIVGSAFIPKTKHAAAMFILPKVLNDENVQELPDKLLTLADEWIEELRPKQHDQ